MTKLEMVMEMMNPQNQAQKWLAEKYAKDHDKYEIETRYNHFKANRVDWGLIGEPELSFEISESKNSLDEIIEAVQKRFPNARFNRTESRYDSCIVAIFNLM